METEFINVYIQKQKSFIEDLVSKNLILDTKVTIAEKVASDLSAQVNTLRDEIKVLNESISKKTKSANTSQ